MSSVEQLYTAYTTNEPLKRGELEISTMMEAYEIQDKVLELKQENGEVLMGYKISLTSQETQNLFESNSPLYGGMTDRTVLKSISLKNYNMPLLEMELIFLVDEEISPEDTEEDIMRKCRIAPGAEIPDGRYENWFPNVSLHEIIADGAVNGAVIYGEAEKFEHADIEDIKGILSFEGSRIKEGQSAEVLGHPAKSVQWLAGELEKRNKKLVPGLFISSGTFNLPVNLEAGYYTVEYENVGKVGFEVTE